MDYTDRKKQQGVSPVIGVILMVAITVVLAAVIGTFVLDLSSMLSEEATAGASIEDKGNNITVQYLNKGTADKIYVTRNGQKLSDSTLTGVGESYIVPTGEKGDTISVIGISEDGSENVIRSMTVEQGFTADFAKKMSVSGVVQINPKIEGATVKAVKDGEVIGSTTTDSNGEYSLEVEKSDNINITVIVDGFNSSELSSPLYASASQSAGETTNFSFINERSATVDGNTVLVSSEITENSTTVKQIGTVQQFQAIGSNSTSLSQDYELVSDIDATETSSWNGGSGIKTIGTYTNNFTGSINGNGHTINGLTIDRGYTSSIFGHVSTSGVALKSIKFTSVSINKSNGQIGGFIAKSSDADYKSVTVTGSAQIDVDDAAGGFIGVFNSGTVTDVHANMDVSTTGASHVGGLVGKIHGGTITQSSSSGAISGYTYAGGGLVGRMKGGTISQSSSSVTITDSGDTSGGLVGLMEIGTILDSYSTADLSSVSGNHGGIVGEIQNSDSEVRRVYAAGPLNGGGGLIGEARVLSNVLYDSYWDTEATGASGSGIDAESNVTGLTTSEMQGSSAETNMTAFGWSSTWTTVSGDYPELQ